MSVRQSALITDRQLIATQSMREMAKDVFQVHDISENGRVIFNKAIKRAKLLALFETCSLA